MKERENKVENIFFLLVPLKLLKFSNLRKYMLMKCKNVVISPKKIIFHRNSANNMQIATKTVN